MAQKHKTKNKNKDRDKKSIWISRLQWIFSSAPRASIVFYAVFTVEDSIGDDIGKSNLKTC